MQSVGIYVAFIVFVKHQHLTFDVCVILNISDHFEANIDKILKCYNQMGKSTMVLGTEFGFQCANQWLCHGNDYHSLDIC